MPRSIFRQPGAQHFQLVHRSQRDPLIHDPDAPRHVLRPFVRENAKKHDDRANVGEAAMYGIYFDDTEYDYMQHLRTVGTEEDGVESILIEAPNKSRSKARGQDIPAEALPSKAEMPRTFETQEAVPSSIAGFQPDMDPHLRQTLEALDDDAFVDDAAEDDFFAELVRDGERDEVEEVDYEFYEYGPPGSGSSETQEDESWEARFARFKDDQKNAPDSDSDGGDTLGNLPKLPVVGGKRRRKGTSDASGYSMSSSSMYRTDALLTLDERFDQLMAKEYGSDDDDDELETSSTTSSSSAPDLITSREDYAGMVDEFMDRYELLGRKLKPTLAGESGAEKLETLRRALRQDERVRVVGVEDDEKELDDELFRAYEANEKEDRWDCETILTTCSNLENHPRVIRARSVPRIGLDSRTGLPSVATDEARKADRAAKQTVSRARDESKEDKRARKRAVKAERQTRRAEKRATRAQYGTEMREQAQGLSHQSSRVRKL